MDGETFEVTDDFLSVGRTFAEYRRLFDIEPAALAGESILDCGGGAAAFTAVASDLGADAWAVDPMYGPPATELAPELDAAVEYNVSQLREQRDAFVWAFYGDVDTRERYLRAAHQRFLADYVHNPDRYVAGALPDLPFESNAVDRALSANLLFLYDDRLDEAFHVAALRDLARVAREEVRVFPLASLDCTRSALVDPVADRLRAEMTVECQTVPYEFQPGATEMLVLRPGA